MRLLLFSLTKAAMAKVLVLTSAPLAATANPNEDEPISSSESRRSLDLLPGISNDPLPEAFTDDDHDILMNMDGFL
uniref:Uncharacterized protein n=1 Tax=Fagus sylvatica TaxID=28930 RepID=A0A2N9JAI9_FAGSY